MGGLASVVFERGLQAVLNGGRGLRNGRANLSVLENLPSQCSTVVAV